MTKTPPAISPQTLEAVSEALWEHDQLTYPEIRRVKWSLAPEGERKMYRAKARVVIDAHNVAEMMPVKPGGVGD